MLARRGARRFLVQGLPVVLASTVLLVLPLRVFGGSVSPGVTGGGTGSGNGGLIGINFGSQPLNGPAISGSSQTSGSQRSVATPAGFNFADWDFTVGPTTGQFSVTTSISREFVVSPPEPATGAGVADNGFYAVSGITLTTPGTSPSAFSGMGTISVTTSMNPLEGEVSYGTTTNSVHFAINAGQITINGLSVTSYSVSTPTAATTVLLDGDYNLVYTATIAFTPSTANAQTTYSLFFDPNGGGAVTPEPSSLVLASLGALGAIGAAWRRRRLHSAS